MHTKTNGPRFISARERMPRHPPVDAVLLVVLSLSHRSGYSQGRALTLARFGLWQMALVWAVWCKLHDFAGTTPLELSVPAPRHFERRARGLSLSVSLDNVASAASASAEHAGDSANAQQNVPVMHGAAPSSHGSRRDARERRRSEPGPQSTQVYVRTNSGAYAYLPGASLVR
jgi:hypothetical protein